MTYKIKESIAFILVMGFLAFVTGIENYNLEMGRKFWNARAAFRHEPGAQKTYCKKVTFDSTQITHQRIAKN